MADSKQTQAVFVISVAAELAGMHPQTLRIWERRGLVEPYRTPGGTRRYSQEDIERLSLIQSLSDEGLNLEGVRRVLELRSRIGRLEAENKRLKRDLTAQRDAFEQEIATLRRGLRRELMVRTSNPLHRQR